MRLQEEGSTEDHPLSRKKAKGRFLAAINSGALYALITAITGWHGVTIRVIGVVVATWMLLALALWLWAFRRWPLDVVAARRGPGRGGAEIHAELGDEQHR